VSNVRPLREKSSPESPSGPVFQWPSLLVFAGVGIALALIALDSFRKGAIVLSASVLLAAFLRLLLADNQAGWLAVRTRRTDVIVLLVLGIGLAMLAFWVPAPS
jgi:hypothetical protein